MKQQLVYLNPAQQEYNLVSPHTGVVLAGRRFGKSMLQGITIRRNVFAMPGSTGVFVAETFKQASMRTLPSIISSLALLGLKNGIHFVVGKKPHKSLGYGQPKIPPLRYDDVVSFFNGSIMVVISQDVPLSTNSMTVDWIVGDEAKGLDFEKLKDETFPANGGTTRWFGDCPWHHSMLFTSDMPVLKEGKWLLNYSEKATEDIIETIKGLRLEYDRMLSREQNTYTKSMLAEIRNLLGDLRRHSVFYREWSTFENVEVVGLEYIRQMKRDLPPLVFQTSILSRRIGKVKTGFYPNFSERVHCYTANNNSAIRTTGLISTAQESCLMDGDLDPSQPICIGMDYNANINWIVAGQVSGSKLKVLRSFYVKYERKLRELVNDFCEYYRYHKTKTVVFYYDSTALGQNYAVSKDDFASIICEQFTKNGWRVMKKYLGNPMKHHTKYTIINDCFTGSKHLIPMFNKENNYALLIAIQQADVYIGTNGFQKHKAGEKLIETEADMLEYRTDGTDAFDTLLLGCILQPYKSSGSWGSSVQ